MSRHLQTVVAFATELLLWLLPASCFLAAYTIQYNGPESAIIPHLNLIVSLGLAWLGIRLVVEHAGLGQSIHVLFQILYSLNFLSLLIYYTVVLVGLNSWGRVVTWRLIKIYLRQWRDLVMVLDVPVFVMPLALCLLCVAAFLLVRTAHTQLPWPKQFAKFLRLRISMLIAIGGLVPFGVLALETLEAVNHNSGEPVMLSLNHGLGTKKTQNNHSEGSQLLDKHEAEAAAKYHPGPLDEPRNVIMIVGDALRGDHLSTFGYPRRTTPYLDRLAETSKLALAQRIHSVCAESYCGLMSIARSKFVHEFSRESLTLQQVLRLHGYKIALILGGDHTNFYGLSKAYGKNDLYWDGSMGEMYVNDDHGVLERTDQLPEWDGTPMFLQIHLMSTHGLGKRQKAFEKFTPAQNYYRPMLGTDNKKHQIWASNYYDNGLLQFDTIVKDLLTTLQQNGYLEDTLVIITGDHGEMLGEHNQFGHAAGVRQPVLDIPLFVLRYGYKGKKLGPRKFISQVDIAPTIIQELGLTVPASWSGVGLQETTTRQFLYFQQSMEIGLLDLRNTNRAWKFWTDMSFEKSYLFDITQDSDEMQNIVAEAPSRLRSEWMMMLLPASNTFSGQLTEKIVGSESGEMKKKSKLR